MIKLREILYDVENIEPITIKYYMDKQPESILLGLCEYYNKKLIPIYDDSYSLDDEFISYTWFDYKTLEVWVN